MDADARVCPFCGDRPGEGMFCESCGRSLGAIERLPTRAEWEHERNRERGRGSVDAHSLSERCTAATANFLAAMHAAGNPGVVRTPMQKRSFFQRTRSATGWVLRPVEREDFEKPRRYEPGLVLSIEGGFYRLHSELRGWGQSRFPHYHHTVESEAIDMPAEQRLVDELAAVLELHDVGDTDPSARQH
jgi:hypothetical protein